MKNNEETANQVHRNLLRILAVTFAYWDLTPRKRSTYRATPCVPGVTANSSQRFHSHYKAACESASP